MKQTFLQTCQFLTQLKHFDKELDAFSDHLTEFPVTFPPSYPFEEKISHASSYMQTRCPAWCDRVLLSHTARKLISDDETVEYGLMGRNTCMGDHKVSVWVFVCPGCYFWQCFSLSCLSLLWFMQPVFLDFHILVAE